MIKIRVFLEITAGLQTLYHVLCQSLFVLTTMFFVSFLIYCFVCY